MAANAPSIGLRPTHISATFQIVTPDQLRKIILKLCRVTGAAAGDEWSVEFELDERPDQSRPFDLIAQLRVTVDPEDHQRAEATARHGLDQEQHAQVLAAADTARDALAGLADPADARNGAKAVLKLRNPQSPL